ncbi:Diphthamide biosynthesis protein 2 [Coemansia sp. RSA 552]|nr:Diphthamide biosynthesis protein 2 [Coemansia sp. RSA 552]
MAVDNDGSAVIQRELDLVDEARAPVAPEDAVEVYEVCRTAQVIQQGSYERVALQFPDEQLADSTLVAGLLREQVPGTQVFILADTSYGSCCVDEVAAEHYDADLVVHYGRTCLSLTTRLPVFYVLGREPVDAVDCAAQLRAQGLGADNVLVVGDVSCEHALDQVARELQPAVGGRVAVGRVDVQGRVYVPGDAVRPGRVWDLGGVPISEYTLLFVGSGGLALTNLLVTQRCAAAFSYEPRTRRLAAETRAMSRHVARRYFMVQKARDADVVGIVVGTLAAQRYLGVVEALKAVLRRAGRKYYVFVVGKLNVAKLANFPEIEAYVLVACPENSLVDSREFFQPVVTPHELLLALARDTEWSGNYITDFHGFLDAQALVDVEGSDEPHFSMVTGQLKHSRRYHAPGTSVAGSADAVTGSAAVATQPAGTEIAQYMGSAAAEYLLTRAFRGLGHDGSDDSEAEPMAAVEGLSGIARGYTYEKH